MNDSIDSKQHLVTVVRPKLILLEDIIIIGLLKRSQYKQNETAYTPGAIKIPDFERSYFDLLLQEVENAHAKAGRYQHPEQHPFSKKVVGSQVMRTFTPEILEILHGDIQYNPQILAAYMSELPHLCEKGDDGEYGACCTNDVEILQALSERIHYGKHVAESKFIGNKDAYIQCVLNDDRQGILDLLVDKSVEEAIGARVAEKGKKYNIDPQFAKKFYLEHVIPITINLEVDYFIKRAHYELELRKQTTQTQP